MTDRFNAFFSHPLMVPMVACIGDLRTRPRMLAALAGALAAFAQPPFGFLPGLFGYGLLLYALELDLGPHKNRTAFFMGWLAGFCYFLISCFWVAEAFLVDAETYGWMAPFAAALLPSGIGLFWGVFAVIYRRFRPKGTKRFLFFASLFCVLEILRGTVLSGFPWNPAGSSWKAGSALSQMAAYVGVYGLSFITVLVFSGAGVVRRDQGVKGYAPLIWGGLVLVMCFALGETRLLTTPVTYSDYTVRVVQPDVGQKAKWTDGAFDNLFMSYINLSKMPPKPGHHAPDVIIWPEGALTFTFDDITGEKTWTAPVLASLLHDNQSLIMGSTRQDLDPHGKLVWRNSMMVLHQSGEQMVVEGAYDKYKLVPFGEFTPFESILKPMGIEALTHFDDSFTPGERTRPVKYDHIPGFLPLICYEAIFPGLDRTKYNSHDDILRPKWIVNISNDAWFGPTTGPRQHLNLASFRAIEAGLPMVRSTPTGISVLVDPLGRTVPGTRLDLGQRGFADFKLPNPLPVSGFQSDNDTIVIFISLFCLIMMSLDTFVVAFEKLRSAKKLGTM